MLGFVTEAGFNLFITSKLTRSSRTCTTDLRRYPTPNACHIFFTSWVLPSVQPTKHLLATYTLVVESGVCSTRSSLQRLSRVPGIYQGSGKNWRPNTSDGLITRSRSIRLLLTAAPREDRVVTSADLLDYGFVVWYPFTIENEKTLLKLLPAAPGVYAVRCRKPSDIAGGSDIVYFGKAANRSGLRQRIRQYYHPGHANRTSLRIRALLTDCANFEISFVETAREAAEPLEKKLISKYKASHKNRPPWNKCD
jgi:hypothetical protein